MIKKNIMRLLSYSEYTNYCSIEYLKANIDLFDDDEFVLELFSKYCIKSNLLMVEYIYENNHILTNSSFNFEFYTDLFVKICKKSRCVIVEWYIEKFKELLDLQNTIYLISSTSNQDDNVFKYILSISKNYYLQKQYEKVFLYCTEIFKIRLLKLIYKQYPDIDLFILNDVNLYNSIDIYTANSIFIWFKDICIEQNYSLGVNNQYILIVSKKFIIQTISNNKELQAKLSNLSINLIPTECVLCFVSQTDIITSCGHKFCSHCMKSWIEKNFSCPTCRCSHPQLKFYFLI
jgi:hypothetical protein